MVKVLEETNGFKKIQNDNGTVDHFYYEIKNGVRQLIQHTSYKPNGDIATDKTFKNDRLVSETKYDRDSDGTLKIKTTTLYDAKGNFKTVQNPDFHERKTPSRQINLSLEKAKKTTRISHNDALGRKESTEHFDENGNLLYTNYFKYSLDEKTPYEMMCVFPEKNGKKVIETYTTDDNGKTFKRTKKQEFLNGVKIHSTHYNPETLARTKEHLFKRLPNPERPNEEGFQIMTERTFDKRGEKVLSTRKLVNINGHFMERTPEVDKLLKLPSGLRETLQSNQKLQLVKHFISKMLGKSA